jgi:hypothetical protein
MASAHRDGCFLPSISSEAPGFVGNWDGDNLNNFYGGLVHQLRMEGRTRLKEFDYGLRP